MMIGGIGLLVIVAFFLLPRLRRQESSPAASIVQAPAEPLPQPRVKTPKSLNDLKIGSFAVEKRRDSEIRTITGDIENTSENLHRNIRIQLELRDAQGLKLGSLDSFIAELGPRAIWHVLANTPNPRVASVKLAGIKEDP